MSNRLAAETSPYLRQHADNPVHWQPWDDQALSEARESGKPILLSIGYSSCHWCHVMAHESFEDADTARVMNERFVNIKVDREERPDLDKVYQTAHQVLTQRPGGWPLTVFLDPESLAPFFAGTYFPKTPRYQMPSFIDLMLRIDETFRKEREALAEQNGKLLKVMQQLDLPVSTEGASLSDEELLATAWRQLREQYDEQEGGFGRAPKFPTPATLDRVLRHWAYTQQAGKREREALDMVMTTLTKMARGGIYDHLGGGFCRYATDRAWMIPHFEKMLYDNGQLLSLYADALTISPDPLFEGAVRETVGWLLREMRHPGGAFFAALDADSEGEEGKFYVWRRERVKRLLSEDEYLVVATLYGIDKPANFERHWNLHRRDAWRSVVERLSLEPDQAEALLASAKQKLFNERAKRERPGLDDKVLTGWNAMAIKGLAKAAAALDEPAWLDEATRAVDFIRAELWRDGVLFATWKDGAAKHPGYLDDYANLIDALTTLLEGRWRDEDAAFAIALADQVIDRFMDEERGGFFFTGEDHEALIARPKPSLDDAQPPGNGVIAQALAGLGNLFGNAAYLEAAGRTLEWARGGMETYPAGHCSLLTALEAQHYPPEMVILRGLPDDLDEWREALAGGFRPWRRVYAIPHGARPVPAHLPALAPMKTVAYVCSGLSCSLPIDSVERLQLVLDRQ